VTPRIAGFLALLPLLLLLAAVVWEDVRFQRIPNHLVFWGAGAGVLLNGLMHEGMGFVSQLPGGVGVVNSAGGLAIGLGALLPMYWLRAMGAGDVKLMAMVGAFLGVDDVLGAVLCTFLAGGILSLGFAWKTGVLRRTLQNIRLIVYSGAVRLAGGNVPSLADAPETAGKLPYAVAIATGTVGYLVWKAAGKSGWA
jgi:prepilin peptidase CpaA